MERKRVNLSIIGRVQGVFYRSTARQQAQQLGLTGWVRNRHDGSVEVIAEGTDEDINKFIEWCRIGSSASEVRDVKVTWQDYTGEFSGFNVIHV